MSKKYNKWCSASDRRKILVKSQQELMVIGLQQQSRNEYTLRIMAAHLFCKYSNLTNGSDKLLISLRPVWVSFSFRIRESNFAFPISVSLQNIIDQGRLQFLRLLKTHHEKWIFIFTCTGASVLKMVSANYSSKVRESCIRKSRSSFF